LREIQSVRVSGLEEFQQINYSLSSSIQPIPQYKGGAF